MLANLNAEQAAVLARELPNRPGRLSIESSTSTAIAEDGRGSWRALTFQDGYSVAVSPLGRESVLSAPAPENLTPEAACAVILDGQRVRVVTGTGPDSPTLVLRLTNDAPGFPSILSEAVAGWSAGVVEPVCAAGSPFLLEYLTGRASLSVMPEPDAAPAGSGEARTNPDNTPQAETLHALRYLSPGLKWERHDDGTLTVYIAGRAVAVLSDGTLTGYDDCESLDDAEPAVCAGTGNHEGQPVDSCDECDADHPANADRKA